MVGTLLFAFDEFDPVSLLYLPNTIFFLSPRIGNRNSVVSLKEIVISLGLSMCTMYFFFLVGYVYVCRLK